MSTAHTRRNTRDIVLAVIAILFALAAIMLALIGIPLVLDS